MKLKLKDEFLAWAWSAHRPLMRDMWKAFEEYKFNKEEE